MLQAFALFGGLRCRGAPSRSLTAEGGSPEFRPFLFQSYLLPFAHAASRDRGTTIHELFTNGSGHILPVEEARAALRFSIGAAMIPHHLSVSLNKEFEDTSALIDGGLRFDDLVLKLLPIWIAVDDYRRSQSKAIAT